MFVNADPAGAAIVKQIVGEIAALEYAGKVKAIAIVFLDSDGDLGTLIALSDGTKLPMLAGSVLLQTDLMRTMSVVHKDRDL